MKTAISIPDATFERAERFARKTSRTRSKLFSDALEEYLDRHSPDAVRAAMDEAIAEIDEEIDPFVAAASARALRRVQW